MHVLWNGATTPNNQIRQWIVFRHSHRQERADGGVLVVRFQNSQQRFVKLVSRWSSKKSFHGNDDDRSKSPFLMSCVIAIAGWGGGLWDKVIRHYSRPLFNDDEGWLIDVQTWCYEHVRARPCRTDFNVKFMAMKTSSGKQTSSCEDAMKANVFGRRCNESKRLRAKTFFPRLFVHKKVLDWRKPRSRAQVSLFWHAPNKNKHYV